MVAEGWPSRSTHCVIWYYLGPLLAVAVTGLRLFVRLRKVGWKKLAVDDVLVFIATCQLIAQCATGLTILIPNGLGKPIDSLPPGAYSKYLKGQYITLYLGLFSITTPKIAILAYYYRIFITRTFRKVIIGSITCIVAGILGILISLILICRPINYVWNRDIPGKCLNFRAFIFIVNILQMSLNAWIFLLPIPIIARLKVTRSRKMTLASIFLVGLSTLALGVGRIVVSTSEAEDRTYRGIYLAIFNIIETLLHILCCNLPVVFYLFVYGINRVKPATANETNPTTISKITSSFITTSTSHKRINSNDSASSFNSNSSSNSSSSSNDSSNSNSSTDYWLRLCNSYILNDMAPRTVISAGDSAPFDAAATMAAEKDGGGKFNFDVDVEELASDARRSGPKLPKHGIVVKQEIVRSVTRRDSSWNGF